MRGIDILRVDLSEAMDPATDVDLTAPILPQWLDAVASGASAPTAEWGWACRLPGRDLPGEQMSHESHMAPPASSTDR